MKAFFILTKNTEAKQPYHFTLVAPNGEPILSSENYTSRYSAEVGIESVRINSQIDEQYDFLLSVAEEPYFVLNAKNGEPLGTSEMYSSKQKCAQGAQSVKVHAPKADLVDKTTTGTAIQTPAPNTAPSGNYA